LITKVTASYVSYQYEFDFSASANPEALIFDITGIAEHQVEITVDKLATRTVISAIAPAQRTITLTIRILATDVESERRALRQIFREGNEVTLSFETDVVPLRTITGTVESSNCPIFSKEVTMTVTIVCPDPIFYSETVITTLLAATTNPGDVPSGCILTTVLDGSVTSGTATVSDLAGSSMSINMAKVDTKVGGIQAGDKIVIDSGFKKRVVHVRGTTITNIFGAVILPYAWVYVIPAMIVINAEGFGGTTSLEYRPGFGGI